MDTKHDIRMAAQAEMDTAADHLIEVANRAKGSAFFERADVSLRALVRNGGGIDWRCQLGNVVRRAETAAGAMERVAEAYDWVCEGG